MGHLQVFISVPDKRTAQRIGQVLLGERLAACVQVLGPVASSYHWQGRVEQSREWLCIVKTTRSHYRQLEQRVREFHPYEVPEIIALPISAGSRQYLEWLAAELQPVKGRGRRTGR